LENVERRCALNIEPVQKKQVFWKPIPLENAEKYALNIEPVRKK